MKCNISTSLLTSQIVLLRLEIKISPSSPRYFAKRALVKPCASVHRVENTVEQISTPVPVVWILYREKVPFRPRQKGIKRNKVKCKRAFPRGEGGRFYFRLNSEAAHPGFAQPIPLFSGVLGHPRPPYLVSGSKLFSRPRTIFRLREKRFLRYTRAYTRK